VTGKTRINIFDTQNFPIDMFPLTLNAHKTKVVTLPILPILGEILSKMEAFLVEIVFMGKNEN